MYNQSISAIRVHLISHCNGDNSEEVKAAIKKYLSNVEALEKE